MLLISITVTLYFDINFYIKKFVNLKLLLLVNQFEKVIHLTLMKILLLSLIYSKMNIRDNSMGDYLLQSLETSFQPNNYDYMKVPKFVRPMNKGVFNEFFISF